MHHHLSLRRKLIIMISVMASLFLVALDQTIIATALGRIVEEFHAFESLGWVVTAYLITTTIAVPIAGKLSDLFGRRKILLIGVAIFALSSLMSGLSGGITELILWRAVQGIGGGIIMANAFTIVGDLFAARERGKWQGLIGAVFGLSSVVGPLLGGWLTEGQMIFGLTTDWRWTFFINVPIGIIAFTLIAIYSPALKHAKKPIIDYLGAALLAIMLSVLILAVDNTDTIFAGLLDATGMSLTVLRAIMFTIVGAAGVGFILTERKATEPILPLRFFKNHNFNMIVLIAGLFGAAFMGSILYLTQFNQQVFGASPTESGLMLLPMVGGIMLTSIISGQLISRIGHYKPFIQVGFVVATIGMMLLTTLTPEVSYGYEAFIMVIIGLGMGVGMPVLNLAVQSEFAQKDLGVATSSNQLFRSLGSTIGTAVFGAMLTAGIVANIDSIKQTSYVNHLSQNTAAVEQFGELDDANTLVTLNTPEVKTIVRDNAQQQFNQLPESVRDQVSEEFIAEQDEFSDKVAQSFSDSLHRIFILASGLMVLATVAAFFLKERPLRAAEPGEAPGVAE